MDREILRYQFNGITFPPTVMLILLSSEFIGPM